MPEPEFEAYLRQLAQSLGLNATQKSAVADELRDHLEERLQQLTGQGRSRDAACQQALAEFGDAVNLAHDFTLPHQRRQRRQAVRYTLNSVAIVVTTFIMASFYWPVQRPEPSGQVVAQNDPARAAVDARLAEAQDDTERLRAEIETKLQRRDIEFNFSDTPFQDAVEFLSDTLDVDVIINRSIFEDNGVDASASVNLKLRNGNVSAKTVFRLLLRQVGMEQSAAIVIRDGFIDITSTESSHEVQVYNCRDLLENVQIQRGAGGLAGGLGGGGMMGGFGGGGGMFQVAPEGGSLPTGGMGGGIGGAGGGWNYSAATSEAGGALMNVLQQATQTQWVDKDGDGGTMTEFNGLITIGHTQQIHERVEEILKKLRAANAQGVPMNAQTAPVNVQGSPSR